MRTTTSRLALIPLLALFFLTGCFSLAGDITPPPGMDMPALPLDTPEPQPTPVPAGLVYPQESPDTNRGVRIYAEKCAPCHGDSGLGDGPQSVKIDSRVPAIGSVELARSSTPADWYNMVTQGNMAEFMPPFTSLSVQDRWDVVAYLYSLSVPGEVLEQGEVLFQDKCAECHGEGGRQGISDLTDLAAMGERSSADIYSMISEGHEMMPAFDDLSEDDRWVLSDYLRLLTFTPLLDSTGIVIAEAGEVTQTSQTQSQAETEAQVEGESLTAGLGKVNVSVTHASDGALPSDMVVTLRGYDEMVETYTQNLPLDGNTGITFQDIPLAAGRMYFATIELANAVYGSNVFTIEDQITEFDLEITYYPPTTDVSILQVDRLHVFIDFIDETTLEIFQLYIFSNPTSQVLVPEEEEGVAVDFILPPDISDLFVEDNMSLPYRKTENGFGIATIYPDTSPYQTVFSYQVAYDGNEADLSIPVNMDANALILMVPADGVKVKSSQLEEAGIQDFEGVPYSMFTGNSLQTGKTIDLSISGRPNTGSLLVTAGGDANNSLVIGLAGLGLALIGTGVYLWRRNQVEEEDWDEDFESENPEEVIDAIITLDDQYKTGGLPEGAYRQRREELKEMLRELVGEGQ